MLQDKPNDIIEVSQGVQPCRLIPIIQLIEQSINKNRCVLVYNHVKSCGTDKLKRRIALQIIRPVYSSDLFQWLQNKNKAFYTWIQQGNKRKLGYINQMCMVIFFTFGVCRIYMTHSINWYFSSKDLRACVKSFRCVLHIILSGIVKVKKKRKKTSRKVVRDTGIYRWDYIAKKRKESESKKLFYFSCAFSLLVFVIDLEIKISFVCHIYFLYFDQ